MNNPFVMDMDISSMYAWSPLILKQSEIVKLLKKLRYGKSHRAKILLKRRLRLFKGAWIEYDTTEKKEWSKKHISSFELSTDIQVNMKVSFNFEDYEAYKEVKQCLNESYGSMSMVGDVDGN